MKITENNKLIAEFMGLPEVSCKIGTKDGIVTEGYKHPKVDVPIIPSGMQYKYSWDWLMPVVEKIETKKNERVSVNIGTSEVTIFIHNKKAYDNKDYRKYDFYTSKYQINKLQATYNAVVKFIKWYNENKED